MKAAGAILTAAKLRKKGKKKSKRKAQTRTVDDDEEF
jgi:hypothetical protein